jgi:hypothetical protein
MSRTCAKLFGTWTPFPRRLPPSSFTPPSRRRPPPSRSVRITCKPRRPSIQPFVRPLPLLLHHSLISWQQPWGLKVFTKYRGTILDFQFKKIFVRKHYLVCIE